MQNPWLDLPYCAPYVLKIDRAEVEKFNSHKKFRLKAVPHDHDHYLQTRAMPGPYLGNPDAPIVLLHLNPGFAESDVPPPVLATLPEEVVEMKKHPYWKNLFHEEMPYPFFLLDPALNEAAGYRVWQQKLGYLIRATSLERVARQVFCLEFFPYPSRKFGGWISLPSQQYSFYLLRKALARQAVVVVLRSLQLWKAAIPELADYQNLYTLNSTQNVTISPNNCPKGYNRILEVLQ